MDISKKRLHNSVFRHTGIRVQSLFYHKIKFAIDKAQKLCYNETDNI